MKTLPYDSTFCKARGCLLSETCLRARIPETDQPITIFTDEPFKFVDNKFDCPMYWGETQISIFEQLNDIVNGKDNERGSSENGIQGTTETEQRDTEIS